MKDSPLIHDKSVIAVGDIRDTLTEFCGWHIEGPPCVFLCVYFSGLLEDYAIIPKQNLIDR
jgi:hypothetical protein